MFDGHTPQHFQRDDCCSQSDEYIVWEFSQQYYIALQLEMHFDVQWRSDVSSHTRACHSSAINHTHASKCSTHACGAILASTRCAERSSTRDTSVLLLPNLHAS